MWLWWRIAGRADTTGVPGPAPWGVGEYASAPATRGGRSTSADREVREHENATNEAKPESTQGTTGEEVTSSQGRNGDDERTQSARGGESGMAACEGLGLEGETEGGDHESDESHESVRTET